MTSETDLDIERVAENVRRRLAASTTPVNTFWIKVIGDRQDYCTQLTSAFAGAAVLTIIVRDVRFDDPNSVGSDLVTLLERNRPLCEEKFASDIKWDVFGVVLLSRTDLHLLQASSPATLPEWFPTGGGTAVQISIEDLTWTTDAPLDAVELRSGEIAQMLVAIEGALLRRLRNVHERRKDSSSALLELLRREDAEKFVDILDGADRYRATVTNPASFRPSLREGRCLVARLWDVAQRTPPEGLTKPSKALASALAIDDSGSTSAYQTLESVLRRPSSREASNAIRFARSLLIAIAQACQLLTAAAHADDYLRYPVSLLRSMSLDLRRTLAEAEQALNVISD